MMQSWIHHPVLLSGIVAFTLFLSLGAVAVRAHGGDAQRIHACVDATSGDVVVLADNTGYGNPDARCPRPQQQHALDWNPTGAAGPAGPAGPPGPAGTLDDSAFPQVYDYERKQLLIIKPEHKKQVVAVPVPGGGTYAVSAKVTVEGRSTLRARCSLSMLPPLEEEDDVARATISAFESLDPTQTLYLQQVYRIPLRTGLKIFRVRCSNGSKSQAGNRDIELSDASIQALRLQYPLK